MTHSQPKPNNQQLLYYVQRNHRTASTNEIPPHNSSTSKRPDWDARVAPSRMLARNASFSAVKGSALMNGWITAGKRSYEKNTPEKIHIGIMTAFINPLMLSIFCARL